MFLKQQNDETNNFFKSLRVSVVFSNGSHRKTLVEL